MASFLQLFRKLLCTGDACKDCNDNSRSSCQIACTQEVDTGIFEAHHVLLKQAGNETNCKDEHFERDQTRRLAHTQSFRLLASLDDTFKALVNEDIKPSLISDDGVFIKVPGVGQPARPDAFQPITLDKVAKDHLTATGHSNSTRLHYLVCPFSIHSFMLHSPFMYCKARAYDVNYCELAQGSGYKYTTVMSPCCRCCYNFQTRSGMDP